MKNYRLIVRASDREIFDQLAAGRKAVETRAATTKHRNIAVGDTLTFVCGDDALVKTVARVEHFGSLEALFKAVPIQNILPSANNLDEARAVYASFPGYEEKLKAHGILALTLSQ